LIDQSFWLSKSAMKKLPTSTIRRLRTATVIVDVHSVVKELVENALDAGTPPILVSVDLGSNSIGHTESCNNGLATRGHVQEPHE
jgi:hypothetical protein